MTCEELTFRPAAATAANVDSRKSTWTEKKRRRRPAAHHQSPPRQQSPAASSPHQVISAGMLPTLQALANLSCDVYRRGTCLMPIASNSDDAARHMQTTLLEAYCREIGLPLRRLSLDALRLAFPQLQDFSCVLVVSDPGSFFLESPE